MRSPPYLSSLSLPGSFVQVPILGPAVILVPAMSLLEKKQGNQELLEAPHDKLGCARAVVEPLTSNPPAKKKGPADIDDPFGSWARCTPLSVDAIVGPPCYHTNQGQQLKDANFPATFGYLSS
jgi:hypothetical protein